VFGSNPQPVIDTHEVSEDYSSLIDKAIHNGDEHVIKFTETCARENKLNPSPVYGTSARHVLGVLKSEV
jgi:hypothetical protein